jgi:transcriptional regulator with XRE-family HTH domain
MAALRRTAPRRRLADRIRAARRGAGLSQEVVAKKLRIATNQWWRIESGLQSLPAERLVDVARIINVNVTDLLDAQAAA